MPRFNSLVFFFLFFISRAHKNWVSFDRKHYKQNIRWFVCCCFRLGSLLEWKVMFIANPKFSYWLDKKKPDLHMTLRLKMIRWGWLDARLHTLVLCWSCDTVNERVRDEVLLFADGNRSMCRGHYCFDLKMWNDNQIRMQPLKRMCITNGHLLILVLLYRCHGAKTSEHLCG